MIALLKYTDRFMNKRYLWFDSPHSLYDGIMGLPCSATFVELRGYRMDRFPYHGEIINQFSDKLVWINGHTKSACEKIGDTLDFYLPEKNTGLTTKLVNTQQAIDYIFEE